MVTGLRIESSNGFTLAEGGIIITFTLKGSNVGRAHVNLYRVSHGEAERWVWNDLEDAEDGSFSAQGVLSLQSGRAFGQPDSSLVDLLVRSSDADSVVHHDLGTERLENVRLGSFYHGSRDIPEKGTLTASLVVEPAARRTDQHIILGDLDRMKALTMTTQYSFLAVSVSWEERQAPAESPGAD